MATNNQEELTRIKFNISSSHMYFKDNVDRFHTFRRYVYETTINDDQKAVLQGLGKPVIEFNLLPSYINRLLGEFAEHEPSIEVTPAEGIPVPHQVIETVEGYIRHIVFEANKNNMSYEVYKDLLTGGYSVIKVWTEYANPRSMKQVIRTSRAFDVTMCGFDPMARAAHKGDGDYSFEIFPMREDEFKKEYPDVDISNLEYSKTFDEFNWSFKNDKGIKTILLVDYYEKKRKRMQIVELADGTVIPKKGYEQFLLDWQEAQRFDQPPIIVGKPRWTEIETIVRHKIIENQILETEVTDYAYLPHIFVDGNSIVLRQGTSNTTYQMTLPYIYHAKGQQDLVNFGGQCLANYLENMVQHKFIVMKEALPQEEDYLQALADIQHQNTIVVNAFSENDPAKQIPNPIREVQVMPAPPEVMSAYQSGGAMIQTILGSYASNLGKNDNDLSGKAVIESASIGNAAAMPYVTGYLQAWTQLGNIIVDLLPKYIKGIRELPIVKMSGDKEYQKVNAPSMPYINYQPNSLNVNISAGVNFQVQKSKALMQMTALMGVSQEFNAFMNSPRGLPILVKNMTIYGSDELQEAVPQYLQEQQQQQQQAQQMQQQAMQNDPRMLQAQAKMQQVQNEAQKMQQEGKQQEMENQFEIARLANEAKVADSKVMEAEAKVTQGQIDSAVRLEEANTSLETHALDSAAKMAEVRSREHAQHMNEHASHRENVKLAHEIHQANKKPEAENE